MARNLALTLGGAIIVLLGQDARAAVAAGPLPHLHIPRPPHAAAKPHAAKPLAQSSAPVSDQPAAAQRFHGLMAADQTEVRARIGAPDVARSEGAGAMWTYRLPDCALFVFFRGPKGAPADAPARVSGAASGPRVRGQKPLQVNDCIAEGMSRQGGPGGAP